MSTKNSAATAVGTPSGREIVLTRLFDASPELVWKAWTEPGHVERWWGPTGFTTTTEVMDVRVGGTWKHVMHGPDGTNYPNRKVYKEVVKNQRLVYSHGGRGEGKPAVDFETTVTFESQENKTKVTMCMVFASAEERESVVKNYNAVEGGNETLGRLESFLPEMALENEPSENDFQISREYHAPRELVWKAWTDSHHFPKWWGPRSFEMVSNRLDFRSGGAFQYRMRGPNGMELWGKFSYRHIDVPERIVFVNSFCDEQGKLKRHFLSENWPLEVLTVVTFAEKNGKTTVRLKARPLHASEIEGKIFRDGHKSMEAGFGATLDHLTEYLKTIQPKTVLIAEPGKPVTIMTRVFEAPRALVYEAYTKAEHIRRWWGLRRTTTVVDKLDFRQGGRWRFVEHEQDGGQHAFNGEFLEIVFEEKIRYTFEYEPMPGHLIVNTTLFEEIGNQTKVTVTSIYQSLDDKEGMLRSGMEWGANESWDQLEELLEEMAARKS